MSQGGFLQQVAACLHRTYSNELQHFCIVFPNLRAGLFFRKYLADLSGKPVWAPTFRSLNSLMEEMAGLTKADTLSMVFDLFKSYREHKPTHESFDEFYFWGEMLLDDFDDIDKHLVDARDLFRNISDLKEIDQVFDYLTEEQKNAIRVFWQDFNGGNSGSFKTDFATIWPSLYRIYDSFKKRLREKSLGYEGMIQREAVRLLRKGDAGHQAFKKYVFIGFNALTSCESYFFKSLQKQNRAIFFWDYDDYFINNQWHEAGTFIRNHIRNFPSECRIGSDNLTDATKHIEIISVPSDAGQAKVAGQLLEQNTGNAGWDRTTVVLPDEHLLLPALSSLPGTIEDVNITMGYPFTYSPAYSLFERLASLQQHTRTYAGDVRFYHNDAGMILHHPYIQDIAPEESGEAFKNIVEHNRIYVAASDIPSQKLLQTIFTKCAGAQDFTGYLMNIALEIVGKMKEDEQSGKLSSSGQYQLEYLYTFYTSLQRIRDILAGENMDMDIAVLCRLLRKVFASLKIPFNGEPLKGLQVMGMLETRSLDFERVIILSMNEGVIPKAIPKQSFIPYNLRKGFGLTTSERHDAMSAYHFYRLIQRAKDVHLIYNSAASENNTGEMSRFLSQLIYEPGFNVKRKNITFRVIASRNKKIIKERTDGVQQILRMYYAGSGQIKKLSPSALNSYLDCRLRFYFRYIDGLTEQEKVIDEIDQSVFGLLLHKTMELIYQPYIKQEVSSETITQIQNSKQTMNQALLRAFAEYYFHAERVLDSDITGRNIIIKEVLMKYICRVLEVDKTATPFTVLNLEEPVNIRIPVHNADHTIMLNMAGFIDRLEETQGGVRIIDYKTGNAKRTFTGIADLFDRNKTGNHAVMQTLLYACMTQIAHPEYSRITSGLYVMKDLFKENYAPCIGLSRKPPIRNYSDVSDEFEKELNTLLSEIFLSNTNFTQTENTNTCLTCPYADICHRKRR